MDANEWTIFLSCPMLDFMDLIRIVSKNIGHYKRRPKEGVTSFITFVLA